MKGRAIMRFRVGRWDDALRDFQTVQERAHQRQDAETEVDVLLDQAEVLDWMGEIGQSASIVDKAHALADGVEADWLEARLTMARGRAAFRRAQPQEAIALLTQAAAQAERAGEAGYETFVIALFSASRRLRRGGTPRGSRTNVGSRHCRLQAAW